MSDPSIDRCYYCGRIFGPNEERRLCPSGQIACEGCAKLMATPQPGVCRFCGNILLSMSSTCCTTCAGNSLPEHEARQRGYMQGYQVGYQAGMQDALNLPRKD